MAGSLNGVPCRSRHPVRYLVVDGNRHKQVIRALPHMHSPLDCRHVEGPASIKKFGILNQSVAALREAFGTTFTEGVFDTRLEQNPPVVVVDRFQQLFEEGLAEVFGGQADGCVHETKAGFEMQREESSQRVGL